MGLCCTNMQLKGKRSQSHWPIYSKDQPFSRYSQLLLSALPFAYVLWWPIFSVVPWSRFLGDTSVPLPEFQRDICKFWGPHPFHLIFTCKIENSFPEISVNFYLHLSSMSIVLAQEGLQITVRLFLHCRSFEFPSKYSISTLK